MKVYRLEIAFPKVYYGINRDVINLFAICALECTRIH